MEPPDRKFVWAGISVLVFAILLGMVTDFEPLRKWQDLVAGMLALVAACLGGAYLQEQIRASDRQEDRRRRARFTAARATMPLTLSAISDYAVQCASTYGYLHAACGQRGSLPQLSELPYFPELPMESVQEFRALIEYGDDRASSDPIRRLLSLLQIQRARVKSIKAWHSGKAAVTIITAGNLEDEIINTAEIYARASALFSFGRFRNEVVPEVTKHEIIGSLDHLGFFYAKYADLYERAEMWVPAV